MKRIIGTNCHSTRLGKGKQVICEKRKHVHNLIREAGHDYANHKTCNLYKKINAPSKNYKQAEKFLRNEDGTLIMIDGEISDKWVKYFDKLLNCPEPEDLFPFDDSPRNLTDCPAPTKEEINANKVFEDPQSPERRWNYWRTFKEHGK